MSRKHPTASVFTFARAAGGWRLALIHHPRFGRWMVPGGHVEPDENPAQTACREVAEETGLAVTLLAPAGMPPSPRGLDGQLVPMPWWIVEEPIPAGTEPHREPHAHVHIGAWYVAFTSEPQRVGSRVGAEQLAWSNAGDLAALEMFEGTREAAWWLLANLDRLAAAPQSVRAAVTGSGRTSGTRWGRRGR